MDTRTLWREGGGRERGCEGRGGGREELRGGGERKGSEREREGERRGKGRERGGREVIKENGWREDKAFKRHLS